MNQLSANTLKPQQLYSLLAGQVRSYHRHYHMGENSSVPTEVAQELLESIRYTLDTVPGTRLEPGQQVLAEKLERAKRLHRLVEATAPEVRSQCHWETVRDLGQFLEGYDHLHFAHRIPEELYYPLLMPIPEEIRGVDYALAFLNCLWRENQILEAFPAGAVEELYACLPPDYWEAPQNLCEQPLWNGLANVLLGEPLDRLYLEDRERLTGILRSGPDLAEAMKRLCQILEIPCVDYAMGAVAQLRPRLAVALPGGDLSALFV